MMFAVLFFSVASLNQVSADEEKENPCKAKATIKGTPDNDFNLFGTDGDDVIAGKKGDDILRGFDGDDILRGGQGNDRLIGDKGEDVLCGGPGDDWIDAVERDRGGSTQEPDIIKCGGGKNDFVVYVEGVDILVDPKKCENKLPIVVP